jgi:hypothetical protein
MGAVQAHWRVEVLRDEQGTGSQQVLRLKWRQ